MKEEKSRKEEKPKRIGIVRVRGGIGIRSPIKDTLKMLGLNRSHYCTVREGTDSIRGMVKKMKDYVTYGEIADETFKLLVEKRGKPYKGRDSKAGYSSRFFVFNSKKYKRYFRLNPPKCGFERKGIKVPFSKGGALGYRGDKINQLIKRML